MDLLDHLTHLDAPGVAQLLRCRPDVLTSPAPVDLQDLAERLDDPRGARSVLDASSLPVLQVSEALAALGGTTTRQRLSSLLGVGADDPELASVLERMRRSALVLESGSDLHASPGLVALFPRPLQAGPAVRALYLDVTGEWAKQVLARLGVSPPGKAWTKATALAALIDALRTPEFVRGVVDKAPEEVRDWLVEQAWGDPSIAPFEPYTPAAYAKRTTIIQWASERGLVSSQRWDYTVTMPAEVALALRGPGYRAPFDPRRPAVTTHAVSSEAVESAGAAAASAFDGAVTAVLDRLRGGLTLLKSGGVGARELTKLATATGTTPVLARVALELVAAAGATTRTEASLVPGEGFDTLRDAEPADRVAHLLGVWWHDPFHPGVERLDGKARPVVGGDLGCRGCRVSRTGLVGTLATLPPGQSCDRAGIAAAVRWSSPLGHPVPDPGAPGASPDTQDPMSAPYAHPWREAELLGVIAQGAVTTLGRALADDDPHALRVATERLLPASVDDVLLGADATAVVTGSPSARVTRLLDACADRESRGAGAVWRLTPGSIRRALDSGTDAADLAAALEAVSRTGLPATTRVLIDDVARRHGSLRVRSATAVLRSDDVPLLAQAVADRSLARLGLRLLAPTVATCSATVTEALTALRAAGYLPMPEDASGTVKVAGGSAPIVGPNTDANTGPNAGPVASPRGGSRPDLSGRRAGAEPDLDHLAATLVAAGRGTGATSGTAAALVAGGSQLNRSGNWALGYAIDASEPLHVHYISSAGTMTSRSLSNLQLQGRTLWGWDSVRDEECHIALTHIVGVGPAA